jgi:L-ribulokinase
MVVYDPVYAEYEHLHDYFGHGEKDVMERLKTLKARMLAGAWPVRLDDGRRQP